MIAGPQFLERPVHVDEELINHRKTTGNPLHSQSRAVPKKQQR